MGEVGCEGGAVITDHFLWKSVMTPDMFEEQPGNSCGVWGGDCRYSVDPLGQVIHHHQDSIVALQVQEFSNHVYGDHLPALVGDFVGDQLPHLLHREGLCPVAHITPCNELVGNTSLNMYLQLFVLSLSS